MARLGPLLLAAFAAAAPAYAQLSCAASAQSPVPLIRFRGQAELVSDVIVVCSGLAQAGGVQTTVTVTLNTIVGSRLLNSENNATEALLLRDDPRPGNFLTQPVGQFISNANTIQGVRSTSTSIIFGNVPLTTADEGGPVSHRFRITNIRANVADRATGFGVTLNVAMGTAPVQAATQTVATVGDPLRFTFRGATDGEPNTLLLRACDGNKSIVAGDTVRDFNLKFSENFPSEFRERNPATSVTAPLAITSQNTYNGAAGVTSETGFFDGSFTGANSMNFAGLANQGTRLMARFVGIPAGVGVWVTTAPVAEGSSPTGVTARITNVDANGAGQFSPPGGTLGPWVRLGANQGSAIAVWEVFDANPSVLESLSFGVVISVPAQHPNGGTIAAQGFLGPFSTADRFDLGTPIPNFSSASSGLGPSVAEVRSCEQGLSIGSTSPLPPATAGVLYSLSLAASGGTLPYAWSVSRGNLPPGFTLSSSGLLSGTAPDPGTFTFTLRAVDARGVSVEREFTLVVDRGLSIVTACPLRQAQIGLQYTLNLAATGGTPPYIWALQGGLPRGLSLSSGGVISGIPAEVGSFDFTLRVTDTRSLTGVRPCQLRVGAPLRITPAALSFTADSNGSSPPPQFVSLLNDTPGQNWSARVDSTGGWLKVPSTQGKMPALVEVGVTPGSLAPGQYSGTVVFFAEGPSVQSLGITVNLTVNPPAPAQLASDPAGVIIAIPTDTPAVERIVTVSNRGSGAIPFTAALESPVPWLSLASATITGRAGPDSATRVRLRANPSGLGPGVYRARLRVRNDDTGDAQVVPVTMAISQGRDSMAVQPLTVNLAAAVSSGSTATSNFSVIATAGTITWQANIVTDPALPQWLSITPRTGRASAGSPSRGEISANSSGLSPGRYFGEVVISAPGSDTPTRTIVVTLNVADANTAVAADIQPAALVFTASLTSLPGRQSIVIQNTSRVPVTFDTNLVGDAAVWDIATPASRTVAPGGTSRIDVGVNPARAPAGVATASLQIQTSTEPELRSVDLVLATTSTTTAAVQTPGGRNIDAICPPGGLRVFTTNVRNGFSATAGLGFAVEAMVFENAGRAVDTGSLTASVAGGAAPLVPMGGGRWAGTVPVPAAASGAALLNLYAEDRGLTGCQAVSGSVTASSVPSIAPGGALSTASFEPFVPLASGGLMAIFGQRLADGSSLGSIPLPLQLGNTRVRIGDARVPLFYAGEQTGFTQVNGMIPFGLVPNTLYQIVANSLTGVAATDVLIADSQPAVLTVNQRGSGQAVAVLGSNPLVIANAANPVARGDALVIYAEGLGPVTPSVDAGRPSPSNPPARTVLPVQVRIGGRDAPLIFSGLTPDFAGLYQINVVVPNDAPTGAEVPLVVTAGGRDSVPVTVAVR
ncbi:MAG: putative Ig domain-containing protein [Bryobacteraceae bacterium]